MQDTLPPDDTSDASPYRSFYRPRAEIDSVDLMFQVADYRCFFSSKGLRSTGLIHFHHLLVAVNERNEEVLYVTAESNPFEGGDTIYLCSFTPDRHAVHLQGAALAIPEFFLVSASHLMREMLDLPLERHPLVEEEQEVITALPALLKQCFPDGLPDEGSRALAQTMAEDVVRSLVATAHSAAMH